MHSILAEILEEIGFLYFLREEDLNKFPFPTVLFMLKMFGENRLIRFIN